MKPHQLTGPRERIEDGLGYLPSDTRYRLRCRLSGRCPDCGQPRPEGRVFCTRCIRVRSDRNRAKRAMHLWVSGAPLHQLERLVIGKQRSPHGGRGNPEGLILSCKCGRMSRVHNACDCCICGEDLWPRWVEFTSRRRWINASDAERQAGLIG